MSTPPPYSEDALAAGLILKPVKTRPTRLSSPKQSPSMVRRLARCLGLTSLLTGAGILVGFSVWTSTLLILRPHPPRWLTTYLPDWANERGEISVQSLKDIEAELHQQQRYAGNWLDLAAASDASALQDLKLLPVYEMRSPCHQDCEEIVELRLYGHPRRAKTVDQWQLLHQLTVKGPLEEDVLATLSNGDSRAMGSTYQLPLASLKPLYERGLPGGWLTLTGRWRTQGSPVLYGQLLYINPQTLRIHSLLNWKSPPGRLPTWRDFDGEASPELLVNQSYGLDPAFRLYTVSNANAINATTHLQEVALTPLALPPHTSENAYRNVLFLAQQGLWSEAATRMEVLKTQVAGQWSHDLERQLQLITLHAHFSQTQADRDWSHPSQKLLALLLDGQWKVALDTVNRAHHRYGRVVLPLLERDSSRIWPRLTASIRVNDRQPEAQLWSALLLMAKEDEAAALDWLAQTKNTALRQEFEAIAQTVLAPDPSRLSTVPVAARPTAIEESAQSSETAPRSPTRNGLFGTVTPLNSTDPDVWQQPAEANPQLSAGQQWYAITLYHRYGQQQWQTPLRAPQETSPAAITSWLQSLGLDDHLTLQLVDPASGHLGSTVTVQGVRWQDDIPTLLVSGLRQPTAGSLMAMLPHQWRTPTDSTAQSLDRLLQDQPAIGDQLLSTLSDHLNLDPNALASVVGPPPTSSINSRAALRWINFVDDADPEILLTLPLPRALPKDLVISDHIPITLILTPQGELLYSNVWTDVNQRLIGWIEPDLGSSALVTMVGDQTSLLTWSSSDRRFR